MNASALKTLGERLILAGVALALVDLGLDAAAVDGYAWLMWTYFAMAVAGLGLLFVGRRRERQAEREESDSD
jgi:hypothetical protein